MYDVLSIEESLGVLRKSLFAISAIQNDPIPVVHGTDMEEPYVTIRDRDFQDPHRGMPAVHPPRRERYILPKHVENVRFEKGDPDSPDYMMIKFRYEEDKRAIWTSYRQHGFQTFPDYYSSVFPVNVYSRKLYGASPKTDPDVAITQDMAQVKLEKGNDNLTELLLPLEYYFYKIGKKFNSR